MSNRIKVKKTHKLNQFSLLLLMDLPGCVYLATGTLVKCHLHQLSFSFSFCPSIVLQCWLKLYFLICQISELSIFKCERFPFREGHCLFSKFGSGQVPFFLDFNKLPFLLCLQGDNIFIQIKKLQVFQNKMNWFSVESTQCFS